MKPFFIYIKCLSVVGLFLSSLTAVKSQNTKLRIFDIQDRKYELGVYLFSDRHHFSKAPVIHLSDSVFIRFGQSNPTPSVKYDPERKGVNTMMGGGFFVSYRPFLRELWELDVSLFYSRKYMPIHVFMYENTTPSSIGYVDGRPIIYSTNIFIPVKAQVRLLRAWRLQAGIGPAFHFNDKPLHYDRNRDARHPDFHTQKGMLFREVFYQLPTIHRSVTFNYTLGITLDINYGLALSFMQQGSLGKVTGDLEFLGEKYETGVKWRRFSGSISYNFNLKK